jgi:NADH-quinone oxidoreductase subunit J
MIAPLIVFFACAIAAVIGAILLIAAREPIHSALSLVVVMVSLAILYLLLGAPFVAAIQILVYAGAIMVLFIFVIMLLNAGEEERTDWSKIAKWIGFPLGCVLAAEIFYLLFHSEPGTAIANGAAAPGPADTVALSTTLFRQYLLPFEATSILILIAILGALVLARKDQ